MERGTAYRTTSNQDGVYLLGSAGGVLMHIINGQLMAECSTTILIPPITGLGKPLVRPVRLEQV
jgi:hypothetical protein